MNLIQANIYGFGKWIDQSIVFSQSDETFICLYGENESGKSTLQQFILYMLFGLPPRKRDFYRPRQSNRVGGQLTVADLNVGYFTIERVEDNVTCLLPHGVQKDETWHQNQLKNVTRETYENIYAFSADDLEEIRRMGEDQLSEVLFSIGLTGATNIYNVEKRLESTLGNLFKKTGKKPKMNVQLTKLKKSYENLHKFKSKEEDYMILKEKRESIIRHLNESKEELYKLREKKLMYDKVEQFLPIVDEYEIKRQKLENIPGNIQFPEDGIDRYNDMKNRLLPLKSELTSLKDSEKNYQKNYNTIISNLFETKVYEEANKLLEDRQAYENRLIEIKQINTSIDKIEQQMIDQSLQNGIKVDDINNYTFPFQLENEWKEMIETEKTLIETKTKIEEDEASIKMEQQQFTKEYKQLQQKLLPDEKIRNMESKVKEYDLYEQHHSSKKKEKEGLQRWIKNRERLSRNTLVISALTAVILFISGFIIDYKFLMILAPIILIASCILFYMLKSASQSVKTIMQNEIMKKPTILEKERMQFGDQLKEQQQLRILIQTIKNKIKRINNNKHFIEKRKKELNKNEQIWEERKKLTQSNYPFLKHVKVSQWIDLLVIIRKIKVKLQEKNSLIQYKNKLQKKNEIYEKRLQSFAHKIDWQYGRFTIESIENMMTDYRKNNELLKEYKQFLEKNKEKQKITEEKIDVYQKEINKLFRFANVENEDDYYKKAKLLDEKVKLHDAINETEQQIKNTFPEQMQKRMLNNDINLQTVHFELELTQEKISELESNYFIDNKRLAEVEHEIKEMEQSEDFSKSEFLFQMQRDEMNDLAQKWAVHKIALSALNQAKKTYQEKYLSEIIHITTTYFKRITNGAYEQVYAPMNKTPFQVESSSNVRYAVGELSQGTIDQLYVSLRLAIGQVMSKKYKIPFIIDDAFVHFDQKRTEQIINILKEVSKSHQVILFTCKENVADLADGQFISEGSPIVIQ